MVLYIGARRALLFTPQKPVLRAVAGLHATTVAAMGVTPTVQYHAGDGASTLSGGRVIASNDLMGFANAGVGTQTGAQGPIEATDLLGRKYWYYDTTGYTEAAASFVHPINGNQNLSVFMVMRSVGGGDPLFTPGSDANHGTALNGHYLSLGSIATYLPRNQATGCETLTTNRNKLWSGNQLHCLGMVSRTSANGGLRWYMNGEAGTYASSTAVFNNSSTSATGFQIGRDPNSGAVVTGMFAEVYEVVVFQGNLTNAQADQIAAAISANWGLGNIVNQVVTAGDSITQGFGSATRHDAIAYMMSQPGSAICMPDGWRVQNIGIAGTKIANKITERDATNSIYNQLLPGRNVMACQILINDYLAGTLESTLYPTMVSYWNTTTTGVLQRGWEGRHVLNIVSNQGGPQAQNVLGRAAFRDPQFLIDCAADPGNTFDGKLGLIEVDLITVGGATQFQTWAGATTYMQSDGTHPTPAGELLLATGGDTPQYGYHQRVLAPV